jgi:hypothetical protein
LHNRITAILHQPFATPAQQNSRKRNTLPLMRHVLSAPPHSYPSLHNERALGDKSFALPWRTPAQKRQGV